MKKKGFTLIELLAVIVILAIIALMIMPVISDLVESSRYASAVDSALAYVAEANHQVAVSDKVNIGGFEEYSLNLNEDNELETDVTDDELAKIHYKGKGPTYVYLHFDSNRNYVVDAKFCIWGFSLDYNFETGTSKSDLDYCGGEGSEPEGPQSCDVLRDNSYDDTEIFKIKNVEDLVCVSEMAKTKTFENKTIYLIKDIDFNNDSSYEDPNGTTYGDINGNGTVEGLKVELTTGKGFYPIGSSSKPFKGTFEGYAKSISNLMINRSQDNIGLFGYNQGKIQGFSISSTLTGNNNIGGVVGYNNGGVVNEVIIISATINGKNGGGVVGYSNGGRITSALVRYTNIHGYYAGGIVGEGPNVTLTGVYESGVADGTYSGKIGGRYTSGTVTGYASTSTGGSNYGGGGGNNGTSYILATEMLNTYDKVLDTYIGGDDDESGYYFDYEKEDSNIIVIKRTAKNPIKFTLKGLGTETNPYIIDNVQRYKEASTLAGDGTKHYFKITEDIDFEGRHYYSLGTLGNQLSSDIDGDMHTLSNISINCAENCGLIAKNISNTIEGLNINNVTLKSGNSNIGGLVGYNEGTIKGVIVNGITASGSENIGGIVGYNKGTVNEVIVSSSTMTGKNSGGTVGYSEGGRITSALVKSANMSGYYAGGIVGEGPNVTLTGVYESGVADGTYSGKIGGRYTSGTITGYASTSTGGSNYGGGGGNNGATYTINNEMLNTYDKVLDTYIGGDNDNSGYYFDYESDESSNIVLKRTKDYPITFTLSGSGTSEDPYLINNYQQFKEATTKTNGNYVFKLTSDIDFTGKHYYALGTLGNILGSDIKGDMHTLSNITIGCAENCGLINKNSRTIEGLNITNITIKSGNDSVGGLVGHNTGTIKGINASGMNVNGYTSVGGIVGYNNGGTINEVTFAGNVYSTSSNSGGIAGYSNGGTLKSVLVKNAYVRGDYPSGGIVGVGPSITLTGVFEKGTSEGTYGGKIGGRGTTGTITAYASNLTQYYAYGGGGGVHGTGYTLSLPTTVTYSSTEIDSLTYYDNVGVLDTVIGGDNDNSGYYLQYNNTADSIIAVKAGTTPDPINNPTTPDSPVAISGGTVGTNPPTCVLEQVIPRSEGIQAVLTCTGTTGAPTIRSQWNVNRNATTNQFSDVGIIKEGTVSGNSKTVRPYWSTSNTISQPHPNDCYYYRFGASDENGNYSYYVTDECYYGFSN